MKIFKKDKDKQYRVELRKQLEKTQSSCPTGWVKDFFPVGGLTEIGFSTKFPQLLLVVSSQGRGLIDCNKLEKIERDRETNGNWINEQELWCLGIGPSKNEKIKIAGLHGGGLPTGNKEGDSIEYFAPNWPIVNLIFQPNFRSIYKDEDVKHCFNLLGDYEPRTYGFSADGQYFVTATGGDVTVYKKLLTDE